MRFSAKLTAGLASIGAILLLGTGRAGSDSYAYAFYKGRQLSTGENGGSSKVASASQEETNAFVGGTQTTWREINMKIPESIQHDYDPRCDTMSTKFQMHNHDALEKESISEHLAASNVGILKVLWYILKVVLAATSLPKLPLARASEWRIDDHLSKEAAAAKFQLTKEELKEVLSKANLANDSEYIQNFDQNWEESCGEDISSDPVLGDENQVSAMQQPRRGALTLDRFKYHGLRLVPRELSGEAWGSSESAWLAFQCAVGRAVDCGLPAETTLGSLVQNRYNPGDVMPHTISILQLLPQSENFNMYMESYLKMKLTAPAHILGMNLPWSNQVQMAIFLAQVIQGCIEIVSVGVLGPPVFWRYYTKDWFFLTFRVELCAPVCYLLVRLCLIQFQCGSLLWGSEDPFDKKLDHAPVIVRAARHIYPSFGGLILVILLPFLPAILLLLAPMFLIMGCAETVGNVANWVVGALPACKDCLKRLGSLLLVIAIFAGGAGWPLLTSRIMKEWLSKDTYICTFSSLKMFEISFDINSISGYLLVILAILAMVLIFLGVLAMCKVAPRIMSPKLVYTLWAWQSRDLLCWALEADQRSLKSGLDAYLQISNALEQSLTPERQTLLS